jgi:hypothetical protein
MKIRSYKKKPFPGGKNTVGPRGEEALTSYQNVYGMLRKKFLHGEPLPTEAELTRIFWYLNRNDITDGIVEFHEWKGGY